VTAARPLFPAGAPPARPRIVLRPAAALRLLTGLAAIPGRPHGTRAGMRAAA